MGGGGGGAFSLFLFPNFPKTLSVENREGLGLGAERKDDEEDEGSMINTQRASRRGRREIPKAFSTKLVTPQAEITQLGSGPLPGLATRLAATNTRLCTKQHS